MVKNWNVSGVSGATWQEEGSSRVGADRGEEWGCTPSTFPRRLPEANLPNQRNQSNSDTWQGHQEYVLTVRQCRHNLVCFKSLMSRFLAVHSRRMLRLEMKCNDGKFEDFVKTWGGYIPRPRGACLLLSPAGDENRKRDLRLDRMWPAWHFSTG